MELSPEIVSEDIKNHKIKEGYMFKKSRYLKEWRERWIVLTKNYIYSFEHKQVYTKPTEILPVADIETLKSYFKHQQEREFSFRAQNKNINFYLAGKTNQEKWAWLSAIQRAVDRNHNGIISDKEESIQAYRATFLNKEQQKPMLPRASFLPGAVPETQKITKQFSRFTLGEVKVIPESPKKITIQTNPIPQQSKVTQQNPVSTLQENTEKDQNISIRERIKQFQTNSSPKIQEQELKKQIVQKIVQKIIEVQKRVQIRIPEYIEKIVYVDKPSQFGVMNLNNLKNQTKEECIKALFDTILSAPIEFKFFVSFIISLSLAQKLQYSNAIVKICLMHEYARHFSEALIITYNSQTDESQLNQILKFLLQIYQQTEQYFYVTDLKVLVDILCRQLQLYRSQLNHYLLLQLIKTLCIKDCWPKLEGYRVGDLKNLVQEINNVTPSSATKELTKEMIQYL